MIVRVLTGLLVTAALVLPSLVSAQNAPTQFLAVQTITVVPGMRAQFEGVASQVTAAFKQTGAEPQLVNAFGIMNGRDSRTYLFVWGFDEVGDMDDWTSIPEVLNEAFGQERAAEILMAGDESIASNVTTINVLQAAVSSAPVAAFPDGPPRVTLIETEVDTSKLDDYLLFLRKLKEAEVVAGVSWTRRQQGRGQLNLFSAARLHGSRPRRFLRCLGTDGGRRAAGTGRADRPHDGTGQTSCPRSGGCLRPLSRQW